MTTLAERIAGCLPAATFELETFVRLAEIAESHAIPTAAIECRARPRMLLNADFVAQRCVRDEHLVLLVMHELWHVILGHTGMYPRTTIAENIAFDAVINAGLARQFPGRAYRGFLEEINPPDEFPGLLLRPPQGWPDAPRWPTAGPPGTAQLVRRLYALDGEMPLYREILELLPADILVRVSMPVDHDAARPGAGALGEPPPPGDQGDPRDEPGAPGEPLPPGDPGGPSNGPRVRGEPVLLGDHGEGDREQVALRDPLLVDVLRRMVAGWPALPMCLPGRDDSARPPQTWAAALGVVDGPQRQAFARVLQRVLSPGGAGAHHRARGLVVERAGRGVRPTSADRLRPARQALGLPATLWAQRRPVRARVPDVPARAHVYLDVSGSMADLLPQLLTLLAPHAAAGRLRAFQFSTVVEPLPVARLLAGELRTTHGTTITPVLEHALAEPGLRRALILTDGATGRAPTDLAAALTERGVRLHVVLPAEHRHRGALDQIAATITVLPR